MSSFRHAHLSLTNAYCVYSGRINPRGGINQQPTNGSIPLSPARNTMLPNFSDPALGRPSSLPSVVEPHGALGHLNSSPQSHNQNSIDLNRRPSTSYSPSQRAEKITRPSRGGSLGQDSLKPTRINSMLLLLAWRGQPNKIRADLYHSGSRRLKQPKFSWRASNHNYSPYTYRQANCCYKSKV
jgi:hypothetical protein